MNIFGVVENNDVKAIEKDVNAINNNKQTALIWSAYSGYTDIVQLLINAGSDVNAKENGGDTALIWAAYNGHAEIVQLLKTHGATE